jgi:uncharacterized protein (DUF885 family)
MKKITLIGLSLVLLAGCKNNTANTTKMGNTDFDKYRNEFIDDLWVMYPSWATSVGYHKYDSTLSIPDEADRKAQLVFADHVDSVFAKFNFDSLSPNNKTDYKMIANFTAGVRFNINKFKEYEWNPAVYNMGDDIFNVFDYKQVSLETKLTSLSKKFAKVPAYFQAAKKNIVKPTREHTMLAIDQNKGTLSFFGMLNDSAKKSKLSDADKQTFVKNADAAVAAINGYITWLQDTVLAKMDSTNSRSFRIGKELYAEKFALDIDSRYPAEEMYKKAMDRKAELHKDMEKLTEQLWSKYLPKTKKPDDTLAAIRMIVDAISVNHCKRDDFMQVIENTLPQIVTFINTHHIIDLDSTKPLKVRKTPEFMAGVAGASINSPGPYDKDAATYYNVTPLTSYSADDAESYLREYNDYVLQILCIHEALPGHYTQLIYANRSPSIVKSVFGNGSMIEGWACYVERMMIEEGYGKSPEMQLFYDKWNLREVCNFILDHNIQCENWSKDQVMDLLVRQAFQEKAEAEEKWKRATLSQVQLASYFNGVTEIYELREDMKKKQGAQFDLKKFHEQFLSYGSAPVKEIRELMLGNDTK